MSSTEHQPPPTPAPPEPLIALSRAFMESRVLLTGAELDLFTQLAREPRDAGSLAAARGWNARALTVVLDALTAMDLLVKCDNVYHCQPDTAAKLAAHHPGSVLASVQHAAFLWERWSRLTERVTGIPGSPNPGPASTRAFIDAMHVIAEPIAPGLVAAARPHGARRLLDVGGASGTYTIAFLEAVPGMRATLFDRPEVVALARERLAAAEYLDRVALVAGDYLEDPLPAGHDLAWLSAVIHSNGPDENLALYRNVFAALVPGGRIVIRDYVMNPAHTAPRGGALFAVNMLGATESGRTYTYEEIAAALAQAGFTGAQLIRQGNAMDALIEARKPA